MNSNVVIDAPKSPESYDDFGVSSLDSDSIQKEASAQVLSEILADLGKDDTEEDKVEGKTASDKVAQEEKVKEEDKKEEDEKEDKEKDKEDKEEDKKSSAEDLALAKSLEKDAASYYDLGRWMAMDKAAESLSDEGVIPVKTSAVIKLHVAGLTDSLVS